MTPPDTLTEALERVGRPLRGTSGLARLVIGLAAAAGVLALMAWLARVGVAAPVWTLLTWVLVAVAMVAGWIAARRVIRGLGPWHIGERLEAAGAWRRGALTTVLDVTAPDTSPELHAAARSRRADEVRDRAEAALAPAVAVEVRTLRQALIGVAGAIVLLAAARPLSGAPAMLWDIAGAWHAITAPVTLAAAAGTVASGEPARLTITAIGRRRATLYTRAPGEGWVAREVELDGHGRAVVTTPPLNADLVARAEAGGHRSTEVRVAIRLGAFLGSFEATAHYPRYLGLDPETFPVLGDTLVLPEGTRLGINGRVTRDLARAAMLGPQGTEALQVNGGVFSGEIVPRATAGWQLELVPAGGAALAGEIPALPIRLVVDSAPVVEVPVPGADTLATAAMRLGLLVAIRDDHGVTAAAIEWHRGTKGPSARQPLALPPGGGDRALVSTTLDLKAMGLAPGDTLWYQALATDNSPARHVGRSREFLLRVPDIEEQRAARAAQTATTAASLDSLAADARQQQRNVEDLAQERSRSASSTDPSAPKDPLGLDAKRKAEAVAQAEERQLKEAEKLSRSVDELQQAARQQGMADSALAARLDEVRQLLDRALTPELRDKLASLQQALKDLDADRTHDALQDLAKEQAAFKDALEQARELFRRAALETDLANQAQEARALADKQRELTPRLNASDSGRTAREEQDLAKRTDSLGAALDRSAQKVPSGATRQGLQQAASQVRSAAEQMRAASQQARDGKPDAAKQSGEQAEQQLDPVDEKIRKEREQMQQQMRKEVTEGLQRALEETTRLAQQQMALSDAFDRGAVVTETRVTQGLLEEGAGKVMQQVTDLAAKNALVTAQAAAALAAARELMRGAVDAVSSASPDLRQASAQSSDAVDALAVAAFHLMQAKDNIDGSQSGTGMQEAMAQMQQMAGQQGKLAQQGQGMMQSGEMSLQQLMQLAMQQRALGQQLDRMRAGGMLPGAGEMAREAKALARSMESGRLNQETVDRQQKLFKRMLDAGRTLQGQEDDQNKERQSTTAIEGEVRIPPALDPRIRSGQGDIRLPAWDALQRLSPEDRRRVIDYFQRLSSGGGQ